MGNWLAANWKKGIRPVEVAITIGLWAGALTTGGDMAEAVPLLFGGLVVSALGVGTYQGLSGTWRIVIIGALTGIFISTGLYLQKTHPKPLNELQLEQLNELDEFIGRKDIGDLISTFDLSNMFFNNLGVAQNTLNKGQINEKYAKYFEGGQGVLDLRYMQNPTDDKSTFICKAPVTCSINLSKKFVDNYSRLRSYENAFWLPSVIKQAVVEFDKTLEEDKLYMSTVINSVEKNQILKFDDPNWREYFHKNGSVISTYGVYIQNLKTEGDKVHAVIKQFLEHGRVGWNR